MDETAERFRQGIAARIAAFEVAIKDLAARDADGVLNARRLAEAVGVSAAALDLRSVSEAVSRIRNGPDEELATHVFALVHVLRQEASAPPASQPVILIIGGRPDFNAALLDRLKAAGREGIQVASAELADRVLLEREVVLVILHFFLPDSDGRTMYLRLSEDARTAAIPVLILAGKLSQEVKNDTFLQSADGYLETPEPAQVAGWVLSRLRRARETTRAARRDLVTGLLNRAAFAETFRQVAADCAASHDPLSIAALTVDLSADTLNAVPLIAREEFLRTVGAALSGSLRATDVVARWATHELTALFPGEDVKGAARAMEKVLAKFRIHARAVSASWPPLSLSAGVAPVAPNESIEEATAAAERCALAAAAAGGNRVLSEEQRSSKPGNQRVLLVLSDPTAKRALQQLLEKDGFAVTLVEAASHTLADLLGKQRFHLFVIDEVLAGRSGFEVLQDVRSLPRHDRTPVVMLTGRDAEASAVRALEMGANDHIARPFSPFTFVTRLRRLLTRGIAPDRTNAMGLRCALIVDDDIPTLLMAATALHQHGGFEVSLARGMADGLQRLTEMAPDVLLVDLGSSRSDVELNVKQLTAAVDLQQTAVIMAWGGPPTEPAAVWQPPGVRGVVKKPYRPQGLGEELARLIGLPPHEPRPGASSDRLNREMQRILARLCFGWC